MAGVKINVIQILIRAILLHDKDRRPYFQNLIELASGQLVKGLDDDLYSVMVILRHKSLHQFNGKDTQKKESREEFPTIVKLSKKDGDLLIISYF